MGFVGISQPRATVTYLPRVLSGHYRLLGFSIGD
jgi:hypothetical protein